VPCNRSEAAVTGERPFLERLDDVASQQKSGVPGERGVVNEQQEENEDDVDDRSTQQLVEHSQLASFLASTQQSEPSQWTCSHLPPETTLIDVYQNRRRAILTSKIIVQQEAFEKCWAHSPLGAAARPNFTLPFTRCRYCRTPPPSPRRLRIDVHDNDDNNNDNA